VVPVDKIAWRCKRVTQNARAATGVGNAALEATGLSVRKGQVFIDLLRSVGSRESNLP
jgi:hypothetical protein